jgi:methylated-DNA-[protein]-cysteine S-methyltransferase
MVRSSEPVPEKSGLHLADVPTPIGMMRVGYQGRKLSVLHLRRSREPDVGDGPTRIEKPPFADGSPPEQLREYFRGERKEFDIELAFLEGSDFDRKVWYGLFQIPYGSCRTYGELARSVGRPNSARAVGGAAGRNPVAIVVPCHRLVGQDRSLTGFGMGLWRKRWLLEHEGSYPLPEKGRSASTTGRQATLEESLRPRRSAPAKR